MPEASKSGVRSADPVRRRLLGWFSGELVVAKQTRWQQGVAASANTELKEQSKTLGDNRHCADKPLRCLSVRNRNAGRSVAGSNVCADRARGRI